MQLADKYYPMTVPFFPDTPYILLVTHSSLDKEKLHHEVRNFKRSLPLAEHFLKTIDEESIFDRITDNEFLLLLADTYTNSTLTPVTVGNGIIVTTAQIPTLLTELEDYLNSLGNLYIITGNIGSGNVSVTTLFDSRSRKYDDDILSYAKKLFSIVKHFNGGISAVGGEGLARTPFISYVYNDATLLVFKKIKEVWDPLLILNPGKKLGTTTNYLQQHLKHSSQER
jgi:FAD/FMN-containing dehydrogenase